MPGGAEMPPALGHLCGTSEPTGLQRGVLRARGLRCQTCLPQMRTSSPGRTALMSVRQPCRPCSESSTSRWQLSTTGRHRSTDGSAHRSLWLSEHRVWSTPPASTRPTQLFSTRTPMSSSDEQGRCENREDEPGKSNFRTKQHSSEALSAPTAWPESRRLPQPRLAGPPWKPETAGSPSIGCPER